MSYTTIKAIYPGEKVESVRELRNSHGSGPVVWEAMANKYLNLHKSYDYPGIGWMQAGEKLWSLWERTDIPIEHRLVFMLTFDRAYVGREHYARMAAAIRKFIMDFPPKPGNVNHLPAIAELLESNPNYPGIGLHCTSVSEDPFQGDWNEEKEDYDPPEWSKIYEICAEIDSLKATV